MKKVRQVCVIGGGSAGFLAALTLKKAFPSELEVRLVRSGDIPIIGVGESTTIQMPKHLHDIIGIDHAEFVREVNPTWKLGLRFDWGAKDRDHFYFAFSPNMCGYMSNLRRPLGFYQNDDISWLSPGTALMELNKSPFIRTADGSPRMTNGFGYHIENVAFVPFLEKKAKEIGVEVIEGEVSCFHQLEDGDVSKAHLVDGRELEADLWIDASGFASILLGKTMGVPFESFASSLLCDRAVVGGWARTDEPIRSCTSADMMESGWQFRIELANRINRGYVFSSQFISDEQATEEFIKSNGGKLETNTKIVPFKSGRYQKAWVNNVVAIGNAQGFVEPLESTGLHLVCDSVRYLMCFLRESYLHIKPTNVDHFNRMVCGEWDELRWFLVAHYIFNQKSQSPFWKECKNLSLGPAEAIVDYYIENGPSELCNSTLFGPRSVFGSEGWWSILVGQKVPTQFKYEPLGYETQFLEAFRKANQDMAKNALTNEETLEMVKRGEYDWTQPPYS